MSRTRLLRKANTTSVKTVKVVEVPTTVEVLAVFNEELINDYIDIKEIIASINRIEGQNVTSELSGMKLNQLSSLTTAGEDDYQIYFLMVEVTNPSFSLSKPVIYANEFVYYSDEDFEKTNKDAAEGKEIEGEYITIPIENGIYNMNELTFLEFRDIMTVQLKNGRTYDMTITSSDFIAESE